MSISTQIFRKSATVIALEGSYKALAWLLDGVARHVAKT
jgi:hypothetical protein